jgi:hypothetical protein
MPAVFPASTCSAKKQEMKAINCDVTADPSEWPRPSRRGPTSDSTLRLAYLFLGPASPCIRPLELCSLDRSDELATNGRPRLRLNERLRADGRSLCWCCALSERNRGNEQHSEAKRCPHNVVPLLQKGRASAKISLPTCWRARSSSASDKSKSAHRPKHCTKPPNSGGMENPMA